MAVLAAVGCASHEDPDVTVHCAEDGMSCVTMQRCPDVPSSFHNCGGTIRPMFGHDMISIVDGSFVSKPVGCVVTLPYEDPAAPGHAVQCTCVNEGGVAENRASWHCATAP